MSLAKPNSRAVQKETPLLRHVKNKIAKPTDKSRVRAGKEAVCLLMAQPKSKAMQKCKCLELISKMLWLLQPEVLHVWTCVVSQDPLAIAASGS